MPQGSNTTRKQHQEETMPRNGEETHERVSEEERKLFREGMAFCCSCNGNNTIFKHCVCVRGGTPCLPCRPGRNGRCLNEKSDGHLSLFCEVQSSDAQAGCDGTDCAEVLSVADETKPSIDRSRVNFHSEVPKDLMIGEYLGCSVCHRFIALTTKGLVRSHGPVNRPCAGSGQQPRGTALPESQQVSDITRPSSPQSSRVMTFTHPPVKLLKHIFPMHQGI